MQHNIEFMEVKIQNIFCSIAYPTPSKPEAGLLLIGMLSSESKLSDSFPLFKDSVCGAVSGSSLYKSLANYSLVNQQNSHDTEPLVKPFWVVCLQTEWVVF